MCIYTPQKNLRIGEAANPELWVSGAPLYIYRQSLVVSRLGYRQSGFRCLSSNENQRFSAPICADFRLLALITAYWCHYTPNRGADNRKPAIFSAYIGAEKYHFSVMGNFRLSSCHQDTTPANNRGLYVDIYIYPFMKVSIARQLLIS